MYRTDGVVLRTKNLGEADKIVTLYTQSHGKVVAVARGSRRIRNRLLGPTQVFTQGRYLIFPGKTLDSLSQGEIIRSNQLLREHLEKMALSMYCTELVDVFTEEGEPGTELYTLLENTLVALQESRSELAVRAFEFRSMAALGFRPEVCNCIHCGLALTEPLFFSREGGGVCPSCRQGGSPLLAVSRGTWELMKRLLDWDWARIFILHPSTTHLGELEQCMRAYLDFRLERPLKSLQFLATLRDVNTREVK